ncbi:5-hydroxytryptamine receptor 3A-like isoform X1 [Gouania willdenowi]|uniref:5-hydroxytryptamine receptor 3A-like isoform X1 n=1 Tax=Gouania willdenowi TaxID=441366 RepID=UPI001054913C|nr:5-hydroxytryptamine receptor 3A-like isoform X1 [Gouania willdenowi]
MEKVIILMTLLPVVSGNQNTTCNTRRCLAEKLLKNAYASQPQSENCTQTIHVPFIEYQTLSVDTKNLRLFARLQATIMWKDPDLKWNTSDYDFYEVAVPVNRVWVPELQVTNAISSELKHSSRDLVVYYDGTLKHTVIINVQVNCEINLFNYPFAEDECPIAIQAWYNDGCGMWLNMGQLKMVDGSHGDWKTENVTLANRGSYRNYILVQLEIKVTNPFITLLLPSILIMMLDIGSFAMPLGGGERNSFKVTLVLSFTLFLNILNDQLPGDSSCAPIIRTHFCVCLVLLVVSMLASMLLTGVAHNGGFIACCRSKDKSQKNNKKQTEEEDEGEKDSDEPKPDITVVQLSSSEDTEMLRKVAKFLEGIKEKDKCDQQNMKIANKLDKIFVSIYTVFTVGYFCAMLGVMAIYKCEVNHFEFWD